MSHKVEQNNRPVVSGVNWSPQFLSFCDKKYLMYKATYVKLKYSIGYLKYSFTVQLLNSKILIV